MSEILSGEDLARSLMEELGPTLTEGPAQADTPSQARDPQTGQFVSGESEVPPSAESATSAESEEEATTPDTPAQDTVADEQTDDGDYVIELTPELEEYLAKYNGDLGAALRAAQESQSLIGRQGNELGDVRRELEQLRQQLVNQPVQQPWFPYQNDLDENPQGLVMEALERGDGATMTRALRAWAALGPEESFEATMFANQLSEYQRQAEAQAAAQQPQDTLAPASSDITEAMQGVLSRHPDAREYADQVGALQESFPTLREELHYGDPAQQARAFEQLLVIAKGRAATPDTQQAVRRLVIKTQEEVRQAKDDAAVISAGNQTAAQADKSNPVEDALDAIFPTPQDPVKFAQTPDGRTVRTIG